MHILIVEDTVKMAQELRLGLEQAGWTAAVASTGIEGLRLASTEVFDGMVVDVMLPGLLGLDLVRRLRAAGNRTPILYLSAKDTLEDRLLGLESGGDDYLTKPYSILEVIARLKVIARRNVQETPAPVAVEDLLWEPGSRRISRSGLRLELSPKEYALMVLLLQNLGRPVARKTLVQIVWGLEGTVDANAVDVQILRLRRKVDEGHPVKLIHTIRGVGLMLEPRAGA